jgi:hypothetical protein
VSAGIKLDLLGAPFVRRACSALDATPEPKIQLAAIEAG